MLLLGFMRYLIIAVWMIFTIQGACCFHLESGDMWYVGTVHHGQLEVSVAINRMSVYKGTTIRPFHAKNVTYDMDFA